MRIHWDYLCNEIIGIGKRKLSIALRITLNSTRKLHLVVYRNVYFLFYHRGPSVAGFERLTWAEQAKNPLFPLCDLLKKHSEADGAFPVVARGQWLQPTALAFCCPCNAGFKRANTDLCWSCKCIVLPGGLLWDVDSLRSLKQSKLSVQECDCALKVVSHFCAVGMLGSFWSLCR